MFLPGPGRLRRLLPGWLLLVAVWLQAFWPVAGLTSFLEKGSTVASNLLLPLAQGLLPRPAAPTRLGDQADALATRESAQQSTPPEPLEGVHWVASASLGLREDALLLAVGESHGVVAGDLVVRDSRYLGRISEVGTERSLLQPWQATGVRTGVSIQGRAGQQLGRALLEGRGLGRDALVRWPEPGADPFPGAVLVLRPAGTLPPALAAAQFPVGSIALAADNLPGRRRMVLVPPHLDGGETLFIAATGTARALSSIRPSTRSVAADWALTGDAVYGDALPIARLDMPEDPVPPAGGLVLQEGWAFGEVVVRRGAWAWVRSFAWDRGGPFEGGHAERKGGKPLVGPHGAWAPRGVFLRAYAEPLAVPLSWVWIPEGEL